MLDQKGKINEESHATFSFSRLRCNGFVTVPLIHICRGWMPSALRRIGARLENWFSLWLLVTAQFSSVQFSLNSLLMPFKLICVDIYVNLLFIKSYERLFVDTLKHFNENELGGNVKENCGSSLNCGTNLVQAMGSLILMWSLWVTQINNWENFPMFTETFV